LLLRSAGVCSGREGRIRTGDPLTPRHESAVWSGLRESNGESFICDNTLDASRWTETNLRALAPVVGSHESSVDRGFAGSRILPHEKALAPEGAGWPDSISRSTWSTPPDARSSQVPLQDHKPISVPLQAGRGCRLAAAETGTVVAMSRSRPAARARTSHTR